MKPRAVVFAYHDVGVRCLEVLLAGGVDVPLVVTHADDPAEARWFASVAELASARRLPVIMPPDPNTAELATRIERLQPDFLFSFYYRAMIGEPLLRIARLGALNMHGSLLPRYRGRAPVNWAILRGERETGATLHYMVARADAGDIVDQRAVPILEDDDARQVFDKVTAAAGTVLTRSLPALIAGTAPRRPQRLEEGEYCGRRRPEDGRIDWSRPAREIHNLIRAVAPPFPGAFADLPGERVWIHRTRIVDEHHSPGAPQFYAKGDECFVRCADGITLQLLAGAAADGPLPMKHLAQKLAGTPIPLP